MNLINLHHLFINLILVVTVLLLNINLIKSFEYQNDEFGSGNLRENIENENFENNIFKEENGDHIYTNEDTNGLEKDQLDTTKYDVTTESLSSFSITYLKGEKGDRGEKGECVSFGEDNNSLLQSRISHVKCGCNATEITDIIRHINLKGDVGPQGPVGPPGLPGPPGPPGRGSNYESGNRFSSGYYNSQPETFSYVARIGEPGPPGLRGFPGTKGEPGARGSKGEKGDPGLSIKGDKGERGKRGKRGLIGPPGPPGELGFPGLAGKPGPQGIMGQKGEPGENGIGLPGPPGPPGPPGFTPDWFDNDLSGSRSFRGIKGIHSITRHAKNTVYVEGPPGPPGPPGPSGTTSLVVPGTVTFKDLDALIKMSTISPTGTLAFITDEQALLVRVDGGWQYVTLGSTVEIPIDGMKETTTSIPFAPTQNTVFHEKTNSLRIAALNQPYNGDLHGIRGADYECYRQSRRINMKTTFRAFVASRTQNLDSIVRYKDSKLPLVNIKGEVLFNSWKDIFTGAGAPFPFSPKIYSFDGRNVLTDPSWPQKLVWHGADRLGIRDIDAYCDAWNSNSINKVGLASSLLRGKLLDQEKYSCNNAFVVLCIETTTDQEVQEVL